MLHHLLENILQTTLMTKVLVNEIDTDYKLELGETLKRFRHALKFCDTTLWYTMYKKTLNIKLDAHCIKISSTAFIILTLNSI